MSTTFNPNISQLKRRAKELKRAVNEGDSEAVARARAQLPELVSGAPESFGLRDAQLVIAREEGYDGWHDLIEDIGEQMIDERDLHRWFGVNLNNGTWDRLDAGEITPESPARDREELLYGAIASTYHWMQVGSAINHARGEYMISRAATRAGHAELALRHGQRCLEITEAHPDQAADWDFGFAHEAIARAHAALGNRDEALEHKATVERIIADMQDEGDREVLEGEFRRGEWGVLED